MKVLLINSVCKNGSTGKITYDLFSRLRADGQEAAICYGRGQLIDEDGICKTGCDWETKLHALLSRLTGFSGCFSYFSTKKLLHFIDSYKPDVVHIHELHGYYANIFSVMAFLKKNRIPVVWTFHCEYMYTGKCGVAYDCERWKGNCGNCPDLKGYPRSLFFDFTFKMLSWKRRAFSGLDNLVITAPSKWLADRVAQSFLGDKKIKIISNGINTDIFYPRDASCLRMELGISDEKIILGIAPRLMSEEKGGKHIVELAKTMHDDRAVFLLIGVDDLSIKVPDNIRLIAPIKDQNLLAKYYSMADVFVLCSKGETFSLTCAEALCCGTPVAGFRSGAPETVFVSSYAAFVDYGDNDALFKAVSKQLPLKKNAAEISNYGIMNFSGQVMYDEMYALYKQVGECNRYDDFIERY